MLTFRNTYIYKNCIDINGEYTKKIIEIIKGNKCEVINDYIARTLQDIGRDNPSLLTQKAVTKVQSKEILLIVAPKELQLPKPLPFVKFSKGGMNKDQVIVDVSRFSKLRSVEGEKTEYSVDYRVLTTLITSAYVTLEFCDDNALLPPDIIKYSAILWAMMYCKVLNGMIQLSTSPDRYYAYMYMAIKFYVIRIMGASEVLANNIGESYIARYYNGKKENNTFLASMELVIKTKMMKPFVDFDEFCYVMFDDEVGNLKGVKVANIQGHVNTYEYVRRFIRSYQFESVMTLGSFPYFYMTLLSGYSRDMMVNGRTMQEIVRDDPDKNYEHLATALIKNIK